LGCRVINKGLASDEILAAMKKALAGGKYVTASLAEKLADSFGSEIQPAAEPSRKSPWNSR